MQGYLRISQKDIFWGYVQERYPKSPKISWDIFGYPYVSLDILRYPEISSGANSQMDRHPHHPAALRKDIKMGAYPPEQLYNYYCITIALLLHYHCIATSLLLHYFLIFTILLRITTNYYQLSWWLPITQQNSVDYQDNSIL